MYLAREKKTDILIAIGVWLLEMGTLIGTRLLLENDIHLKFGLVPAAFIIRVIFVLIKEKSAKTLGFSTEKLKVNIPIAIGIIILTFFIKFFTSDIPINKLFFAAISMLKIQH